MRYAAILEYDGSAFSGWQSQLGTRTVQDCVEAALSKVADAPIKVITAGRTDAGVHACGQVIHFNSDSERDGRAWVHGGNSHCPQDAALLWANSVSEDFNARYSAIRRHYRFVIFNHPIRPTLLANRVTWDHRQLDIKFMQSAAEHLVGNHDFSSFRSVHCQAKSPIRDLQALTVKQHGHFIVIDAQANAFLQHMVRNLAGVLMTIGAGEQPPQWAAEVLAARDRRLGGVTAPPQGLYLLRVEYPESDNIPELSRPCGLW